MDAFTVTAVTGFRQWTQRLTCSCWHSVYRKTWVPSKLFIFRSQWIWNSFNWMACIWLKQKITHIWLGVNYKAVASRQTIKSTIIFIWYSIYPSVLPLFWVSYQQWSRVSYRKLMTNLFTRSDAVQSWPFMRLQKR